MEGRYEGELEKKGGWDGNQFQTRHFTLFGRTLKWYRNREDKPRNTVTVTRFVPHPSSRTIELHCLEAKGPYVVRARTSETFDGWVSALEAALMDLGDPTSPPSPMDKGRGLLVANTSVGYVPLPGEARRLEVFQVSAVDKTNTPVLGTLLVTNYRLLCCGCSVPLGCIWAVEVTEEHTTVVTHSLERFRFTCAAREDADVLLLKLHALTVPFAFEHYQALVTRSGQARLLPFRYDAVAEYRRLGVAQDPTCPWRVDGSVNRGYGLCPSYPELIAVPRAAPASVLDGAASFRTKRRLPIMTWRCASTGWVLCRSAEPGTVLGKREADTRLLALIRAASESPKLAVFDCRSLFAATGNAVDLRKGTLGGSEWLYPNVLVYFCGLINIHKVREYFYRMSVGDVDPWHNSVRELLITATAVARELRERSVLVHCTDGWDRTSQVCAAAQLVLDPYYRTLNGLAVLVEKDWVHSGHKFGDRCGNLLSGVDVLHADEERAPIFLQWLWVVYQLLWYHPSAFEFTVLLLDYLAEHHRSLLYGTFLGNNDQERDQAGVASSTVAIWDFVLAPTNRGRFTNATYRPTEGQLEVHVPHTQHWCRHGNPVGPRNHSSVVIDRSQDSFRSQSAEDVACTVIQQAYREHLQQRLQRVFFAAITIQRAWRAVRDRRAQPPPPLGTRGWLLARSKADDALQRRYFLLHHTLLRWFTDDTLRVPCGCVDLRCCSLETPEGPGGRFLLKGLQMTLELQCPSGADPATQAKWLDLLQHATMAHDRRSRRPLSVGSMLSDYGDATEDSVDVQWLKALQAPSNRATSGASSPIAQPGSSFGSQS